MATWWKKRTISRVFSGLHTGPDREIQYNSWKPCVFKHSRTKEVIPTWPTHAFGVHCRVTLTFKQVFGYNVLHSLGILCPSIILFPSSKHYRTPIVCFTSCEVLDGIPAFLCGIWQNSLRFISMVIPRLAVKESTLDILWLGTLHPLLLHGLLSSHVTWRRRVCWGSDSPQQAQTLVMDWIKNLSLMW